MKYYEFNSLKDKPLLHLSHANGFPPPTYVRALTPLLSDYHIFSFYSRPLWGDCPPETLKHWSIFSEDLLEGLKEISAKKVIGVGHSLGGVTTLYAAVKNPDLFSHVILIDPTMLSPKLLWQIKWMKLFRLEAREGLVQGALRRRRSWESREEAYQSFKGKSLFKNWPDEVLRAYLDSMTAPDGAGGQKLIYPPEWEARIYQTIPTDIWKYAKLLKQPTLVIRGETSNTFTSESEKAFRKANPHISFAVVKGAGHLVPQEKPDEVGQILLEFLRKHPSN